MAPRLPSDARRRAAIFIPYWHGFPIHSGDAGRLTVTPAKMKRWQTKPLNPVIFQVRQISPATKAPTPAALQTKRLRRSPLLPSLRQSGCSAHHRSSDIARHAPVVLIADSSDVTEPCGLYRVRPSPPELRWLGRGARRRRRAPGRRQQARPRGIR